MYLELMITFNCYKIKYQKEFDWNLIYVPMSLIYTCLLFEVNLINISQSANFLIPKEYYYNFGRQEGLKSIQELRA